MNDKLTIEIKAKIFAQYLGCDIQYPDLDGEIILAILTSVGYDSIVTTYYKKSITEVVGDELSWKPNGNHNSDALHCKLVLRKLSDITDEDAIEVAKNRFDGSESEKYHNAETGKCATHWANVKSIDMISYQYLISKGYDLPHYLLDGKTLIESGLAKDINSLKK